MKWKNRAIRSVFIAENKNPWYVKLDLDPLPPPASPSNALHKFLFFPVRAIFLWRLWLWFSTSSSVALNLDKEFYFSSPHASPILLVKHDCPNVCSAVHSILELCSRLVSSCSHPFLPSHSMARAKYDGYSSRSRQSLSLSQGTVWPREK